MAYDINASLERLEKNLQDVDSAREQIEKTVASSNALQASVAKYVASLNILQEEVKKLIADLGDYKSMKTSELEFAVTKIKSSCDVVVGIFNKQIESYSADFKEKMNETLALFVSENTKLANQVKELNALKDALKNATDEVKTIQKKLDEVSAELKKSQKDQDDTLAAIKSSLDELPTSIKSYTDEVSAALNVHYTDLKATTNTIIQKSDSIISTQSELKSLCNNIKSDVAALKEAMDSSFAEIGKGISKNRWIIIIGILVLIALHFIK